MKLTYSKLRTVRYCKGRGILEQSAVRKPAQSTWPVCCTQLVKSPILRHFTFGCFKSEIRFSYERVLHVRADYSLCVNNYNLLL